jgi:hypothetical protein
MPEPKRACLIYVEATANSRAAVRAHLEETGHSVCEVRASLDDALAAEAGMGDLPQTLEECISQASFCVFLLPENEADDELLGAAAGYTSRLGKSFVGVAAGARDEYPESFGDCAEAIVRKDSARLIEAIEGQRIWEQPDSGLLGNREIAHVTCR